MKNIIILLITMSPIALNAQDWSPISLGTSENLNKVYFKNNSDGFIIGDNGTLFRTTDGGTNWSSINTGVSIDLYTISFLNDTIGYVNGLKTIDGGSTWTAQTASNNFGLIYAQDTNNLVAGLYGNFGADIYNSSDGGDNWAVIANPIFPSTGAYDDVSFVNDTVGYLCAWYSKHLVKTLDGGYNWTEIVIDTVDGSSFISDDFRSVYFFSENVGVLTHQNGFLKTLDAGNTWSEIKPTSFSNSFYPRSIIANTANNYIVVGNYLGVGQIEKIYETQDGGVTWVLTNSIMEDLFDVACVDSSCFAVGSDGTLLAKESGPLSVANIFDKSQISVYPNPVNDHLYIDSTIDMVKIELFDMMGKQFYVTHSQENNIDTSTLPSGAYILKVNFGEEVQTIKLIKK